MSFALDQTHHPDNFTDVFLDEEEGQGFSETLSRLWLDDGRSSDFSKEGEGAGVRNWMRSLEEDEEIPEDIQANVHDTSENYFEKEEEMPVYFQNLGLDSRVKRMPRDWLRPRRYDTNLFRRGVCSHVNHHGLPARFAATDTSDWNWGL